jgi:hypothetical protein
MDNTSAINHMNAEEQLAIEGYLFYADESLEFAAISAGAVAAALNTWDMMFAQQPAVALDSCVSNNKANQEQNVNPKGI